MDASAFAPGIHWKNTVFWEMWKIGRNSALLRQSTPAHLPPDSTGKTPDFGKCWKSFCRWKMYICCFIQVLEMQMKNALKSSLNLEMFLKISLAGQSLIRLPPPFCSDRGREGGGNLIRIFWWTIFCQFLGACGAKNSYFWCFQSAWRRSVPKKSRLRRDFFIFLTFS